MARFVLKLLLKPRFTAVHHDCHWLRIATNLLTAQLHSLYVMGSESEILEKSELISESEILHPTLQPGWLPCLIKVCALALYCKLIKTVLPGSCLTDMTAHVITCFSDKQRKNKQKWNPFDEFAWSITFAVITRDWNTSLIFLTGVIWLMKNHKPTYDIISVLP